jgi:hypothetical protein
MRTGSPASFIAWEDLGHQGRAFVSSGPTAGDLAAFFGEPAPAPIRVYVGLHAAATTRGAGPARPPGTRARRRVRAVRAAPRDAHRHGLGRSGRPGSGGVPASGRHRQRRGPVFLPAERRWPCRPRAPTAPRTRGRSSRPSMATGPGCRERPPRALSLRREPGRAQRGAVVRRPRHHRRPVPRRALAGPPFRSELLEQRSPRGRQPGSPAWRPRFRDGLGGAVHEPGRGPGGGRRGTGARSGSRICSTPAIR